MSTSNTEKNQQPIQVYFFSTGFLEPYRALLHGVQSAEERRRFTTLKNRSLQQIRVLSRGITRVVLSRFTGTAAQELRLRENKFGKPFLLQQEIHFSASHSQNFFAIAISEGPVGLDIEEERRQEIDFTSVARSVFQKDEVTWLEDRTPQARSKAFRKLWTEKEAVLKADGQGFARSLKDFHFASPGSDIRKVSSTKNASRTEWFTHFLGRSEGITAAIATAHESAATKLIWNDSSLFQPLGHGT